MKRHVRLLALAAAMISGFANAQVSVSDAWVRATVPQQKATGAFLKLQAAQDSKLVAATSPLTPVVEVHEMAMQDNVMKMRQVPSIALPAGKTVELKPGGLHLMLHGAYAPVAAGEKVVITLKLADGRSLPVTFNARKAAP